MPETGAHWTAVLYGDTNLNIIDGSSVWLVSMAECLARAGAQVHVQLKADVSTDRLVAGLTRLPGVTVHHAFEDSREAAEPARALSPAQAAPRLAELARRVAADLVVCRGLDVCSEAVTAEDLAALLWAYVTDVPRHGEEGVEERTRMLRTLAAGCRRLFAQTEEARSYLEVVAPEAAGKTVLLNPMIPDDLVADTGPAPGGPAPGEPLRMVYSGKFAAEWKTLEMLDLPARLAEHGVQATLTVIGDKVQRHPTDPTWPPRMTAALEATADDDRVTWLGGLPREEALAAVRGHHVGLSWRSARLDSSLELSTKLLEYGALGVAPVLNRTAAHEDLLGADYPLYVDGEVTAVLERAASDPELLTSAAARVREVARRYTIGRTADRLRAYFASSVAVPPPPRTAVAGGTDRPLRVLVAGHDFKFAGELLDGLHATCGLRVRVDHWDSLHEHDEQRSRVLLDWADVVLCEWAGPNAVFYSQHKRSDQRLVVRFHGFEIRGPWLGDIELDRVDRVVFVSDSYRREVLDQTGWPEELCTVVPNAVDVRDLARPKAAESRFHLGIVGIVPLLKRPDRAVELLERLVAEDDRFVLHLKGRFPWSYPWEWRKVVHRDAYQELFQRLGARRLREHVAFDGFSPDIANWLRRVGWVLSPSTRETFHMAPVEGMASGAVPLVWPRPGVAEIFGDRWTVPDTATAAARVLALADDPAGYQAEARAAAEHVRRYDAVTVNDRWRDLLAGAA